MSPKRFVSFVLSIFFLAHTACTTGTIVYTEPGSDQGGGGFVIEMPFATGFDSLCTQGAHGTHSHSGPSTQYDIDLDTSNDVDEEIFAPVAGIARVHIESAASGFGYHINIDLGNGLYVVIAHLKAVFIRDGEEVAVGQLLGYEGCTGNCDGDHVHIGLHQGDASMTADHGTSIPATYRAANQSDGGQVTLFGSEDFECGIRSRGDARDGDTYESDLAIALWHPDSTLVKTPDNARVYLVSDGRARWIENQDVFWSMGYSFDEVVLISKAEFECLGEGADITSNMVVPQYGELYEGDLVKETDASDVYAVSDGHALPIQSWDVYLLMGLWNRTIKTVSPGTVEDALLMGSCQADIWCLDFEAVTTCGGGMDLVDGPGTGGEPGDDDTADEPVDDDDAADDDTDDSADDDDATPPDNDVDNDGYTVAIDCNDLDASVHPGAAETDNDIDDNCNGQIDEGFEPDQDDDDAAADDDDTTPPPADDDDATDAPEEDVTSTLTVEVDYPANEPQITLTVQPVFSQLNLGAYWVMPQPSVMNDDEVSWSQEGDYTGLLGVRFNVNVDTDGNGVNDDWYCYGHYTSAFLEYGVSVDITLGADEWDENDLVTWSPGTASQTELGCSALLWFGNTSTISVGYVQ